MLRTSNEAQKKKNQVKVLSLAFFFRFVVPLSIPRERRNKLMNKGLGLSWCLYPVSANSSCTTNSFCSKSRARRAQREEKKLPSSSLAVNTTHPRTGGRPCWAHRERQRFSQKNFSRCEMCEFTRLYLHVCTLRVGAKKCRTQSRGGERRARSN